jgi:hypothetical protein
VRLVSAAYDDSGPDALQDAREYSLRVMALLATGFRNVLLILAGIAFATALFSLLRRAA